MINYFQQSKKKGFTLIEVMVAVSIFASALVALLLAVGTGVGNVNVSKNKMIGTYLAQEGIETVRYQRDYFIQQNPGGGGWTNFQTMLNSSGCFRPANSTGNIGYCGVSPLFFMNSGNGALPVDCSSDLGRCAIVEDTVTGTYDIAGDSAALGWPPTMFTRYVYLESPANNSSDAYVVHSVVTWSQGTGTYAVELRDTIYNWY